MHCGKKWWIREFVAPYIFPLNPDYVAARSLRSLRSNNNRLHTQIVWAPCVLTNFVVFDIVKLTDFLLKQSDFRKKGLLFKRSLARV